MVSREWWSRGEAVGGAVGGGSALTGEVHQLAQISAGVLGIPAGVSGAACAGEALGFGGVVAVGGGGFGDAEVEGHEGCGAWG